MRTATRIRFATTQKPAQEPLKDASGHTFDPERYIAPDRLTKAGDFRLKPGKSHA